MRSLIFLLFIYALIGCKGGSSADSSAQNSPPVTANNFEPFVGQFTAFNVNFERPVSGPLAHSPRFFLTYKMELKGRSFEHGTINISDCMDPRCSRRALLYKLNCSFSNLSCQILNGQGQDVIRGRQAPNGTVYRVNASEVSFLSVIPCRTWNDQNSKCAYVTVVDPLLIPEGFFNRIFLTEFIPVSGKTVGPVTFHLKARP